MNKCVLILLSGELSQAFEQFLKQETTKAHLEGMVHVDESGRIRLILCGLKGMIDQFIDIMYDKSIEYGLSEIEVEPFFKQKDFRGVFRIVK